MQARNFAENEEWDKKCMEGEEADKSDTGNLCYGMDGYDC